MRRYLPLLFVFSLLALPSMAWCQAPLAPTGWSTVERLKKGSSVVIDQVLVPGQYEERPPCKMVRVDAASLVCKPQGGRGVHLVYPAHQVASVYLCSTHLSPNFLKMILFGGAGWLVGGAITDEGTDYPLATLGAIDGVLYGLVSNKPEQKLVLIYKRAPDESVTPAVSP